MLWHVRMCFLHQGVLAGEVSLIGVSSWINILFVAVAIGITWIERAGRLDELINTFRCEVKDRFTVKLNYRRQELWAYLHILSGTPRQVY